MSHKAATIVVEDISTVVNPTILGGPPSASSSASNSTVVSSSNTPTNSPGAKSSTSRDPGSTGFTVPPITLALAKEAYISRVLEPGSSKILSCRNALRAFFSQPRVFRVHDVFAVIVRRRKYFDSIDNLNGIDFDNDDEESEDEDEDEDSKLNGTEVSSEVAYRDGTVYALVSNACLMLLCLLSYGCI